MRLYRLFDVTIESDTDLLADWPAAERVDLRVERAGAPFTPRRLLLRWRFPLPDGETDFELWKADSGVVLRFRPFAEFLITRRTIEYRAIGPLSSELFDWLLLGGVIGLWLDLAGSPVLHGASIEMTGGAAALLGWCGGGKSTLAASCLRGGFRFIADDHVALRPEAERLLVRPALPWLKVNPDVAQYLGATYASLPMLHPRVAKRRFDVPASKMVTSCLPLHRVYTLRREGARTDVAFERLPPQEALLELVRHSYSPRSISALGLQGERLAFLAEVAERVGVWRLRYPAGLDSVGRVCNVLESHLQDACVS